METFHFWMKMLHINRWGFFSNAGKQSTNCSDENLCDKITGITPFLWFLSHIQKSAEKILWKHVFMLLRICCCYSDHYVLVLSRFYSVCILSFSFLSCLSTLVQCGVPIAFSWYCLKKNTRVVLSLKCIGVCSFFCVSFSRRNTLNGERVSRFHFLWEKNAHISCVIHDILIEKCMRWF